MRKPKMILFDYGQTLMVERNFNALDGNRAVLERAADTNGIMAEEVAALSAELTAEYRELGHTNCFEIHVHSLQRYLYEYLGITLGMSMLKTEELFWDAAAPAVPAEGIMELLELLRHMKIQTGVISNISFSGEALRGRIHRAFPEHSFSFILASSEYVFRKPSPRIFELALHKAHLSASDVWYCGDNPSCDIEGAAACGIFPVWYTGNLLHPFDPPTVPCLTISHWKELLDILAQMNENAD
ncbi:MAG: HAD family hydrolase [Candidatus Merdivicinus sp.]